MNKPLSIASFGMASPAAIFRAAVSRLVEAVSPIFGDTLAGNAPRLLVARAVALRVRVVPARLQG